MTLYDIKGLAQSFRFADLCHRSLGSGMLILRVLDATAGLAVRLSVLKLYASNESCGKGRIRV